VGVRTKVASGSGWTNQSEPERDTLFGIVWEIERTVTRALCTRDIEIKDTNEQYVKKFKNKKKAQLKVKI
jgi:hypothetical protein